MIDIIEKSIKLYENNNSNELIIKKKNFDVIIKNNILNENLTFFEIEFDFKRSFDLYSEILEDNQCLTDRLELFCDRLESNIPIITFKKYNLKTNYFNLKELHFYEEWNMIKKKEEIIIYSKILKKNKKKNKNVFIVNNGYKKIILKRKKKYLINFKAYIKTDINLNSFNFFLFKKNFLKTIMDILNIS